MTSRSRLDRPAARSGTAASRAPARPAGQPSAGSPPADRRLACPAATAVRALHPRQVDKAKTLRASSDVFSVTSETDLPQSNQLSQMATLAPSLIAAEVCRWLADRSGGTLA